MSFPVTIYHNPRCGTSRDALASIRAAGHEPTIVLYLETGWTEAGLKRLLKAMGKSPRDILRAKEAQASDLAGASDADLLAAMVANPVLVERPIVETPKGARLCRPSQLVEGVL
jgi:arsenate reductase